MDMFVAMIDVTLKQGQLRLHVILKSQTRHLQELMIYFKIYCAHMMAHTVF